MWTFLSPKDNMAFTLNDIDLQMTLTFHQALVITNMYLKYVNYEMSFSPLDLDYTTSFVKIQIRSDA